MEHWSEFFKAVKPKRVESTITMATTSDSQRDLDDAAAGRTRPDEEANFFYTQVGASLVTPDGATEHGKAFVMTDKEKPIPDAEFDDAVGPRTPLQQAAINSVYNQSADVMRAIRPDFDAILESSDQSLQMGVIEYIQSELPNGPAVALFLAEHPAEAETIRGLPLRAAQRHVQALSVQLVTDGAMGMDQDDYRTFRAKRREQIARQYR